MIVRPKTATRNKIQVKALKVQTIQTQLKILKIQLLKTAKKTTIMTTMTPKSTITMTTTKTTIIMIMMTITFIKKVTIFKSANLKLTVHPLLTLSTPTTRCLRASMFHIILVNGFHFFGATNKADFSCRIFIATNKPGRTTKLHKKRYQRFLKTLAPLHRKSSTRIFEFGEVKFEFNRNHRKNYLHRKFRIHCIVYSWISLLVYDQFIFDQESCNIFRNLSVDNF